MAQQPMFLQRLVVWYVQLWVHIVHSLTLRPILFVIKALATCFLRCVDSVGVAMAAIDEGLEDSELEEEIMLIQDLIRRSARRRLFQRSGDPKQVATLEWPRLDHHAADEMISLIPVVPAHLLLPD